MNPILAAIAQRLHGGAAPVGPPGPGGPPAPGLPPDLMAAMHGGAPAPAEDDPAHEQNEVQLLTKILSDMQNFLRVAADEDDKAVIATCIANVQKLRAKDQAETDGASQGKTTPRMVRKAAAAQGSPGGSY